MDEEEKAYREAAGRSLRVLFVRDVRKVIDAAAEARADTVFPKHEQAAALRRMAEQLEKSDERAGPVARAQERARRRNATHFFGQPWGRAVQGRVAEPKKEPQPVRDWQQEQEALREKGQQARPMRFFARDRDEQERDR